MLNLILYITIIGSLLGIIIILGRKIPALAKLSEDEVAVLKSKQGLLTKTANKIKKTDYSPFLKTTTGLFKLIGQWLKNILGNFLKFDWSVISWLAGKIKLTGQVFISGIKIMFTGLRNFLIKILSAVKEKFTAWQKQRADKKVASANLDEIEKEEKEENDTFDIKKVAADNLKPEPPEEYDETKIIEQDLADKKPVWQNRQENRIDFADLERPIQQEQELIDVIVKNPKNIIAYKALGLYYFKQCNYKDAKSSLKMAIKLGSKDKVVQETLDKIDRLPNNNF